MYDKCDNSSSGCDKFDNLQFVSDLSPLDLTFSLCTGLAVVSPLNAPLWHLRHTVYNGGQAHLTSFLYSHTAQFVGCWEGIILEASSF